MLSHTAVYALRTMGYIATKGDGKPVLAHTIAEKMDIPKHFISKIAHTLVQADLLQSTRGIHGGFTLTKPATEITLKQVVSLFMHLEEKRQCILQQHECDGSCKLHEKWYPIDTSFRKTLCETTVDQIL